ncbi:uncharacterized protein [Nicotiana tomentosiformis]|uniref:uncharacterized protein n=1 Tax=Nicotiana tomentosiformis TaxID=4098 RepID=UPI00388C5316
MVQTQAPIEFEVAALTPFEVEVTTPFTVMVTPIPSYKSNAIPWDYVAEARRKGKGKVEETGAAQGMTRTGRVYTPEHLGGTSREAVSRQPVIETGLDDLWRKILLSEFDIIYITQKAVKGQALTDHLAKNPVGGEYEPLKTYFPDEEVSFVGEDIAEAYDWWKMFFDGAANFKGVGIRGILVSETGQHYPVSAKLRFLCTNNMAEYEACILGLNLAVNMNIQELLVIGDSNLLMDVIGPIEPAASNGHRFILVAIDYFTKWVEDASYKTVTKKVIADFVRDLFVCRFGVPESIITDNAANLNSDLMKAMCETFKIKHKNSTAYRLQMNGAVEAANKNIKKILRKMVDNHRQWHERLPFALLWYRTTVRTSTGATPYLLVYGTEAVIPAVVEIPSLRIIQEAELSDAEWVRSRYEQLALIHGKIMNVVCHGQLYQNRMSRAFNKRVKPRQFAPGQPVLKRIFPHQDEAKGKFSPNWQGPYMVHRVLTGGALILAEMDGEIWPKPINSDAVKRYYV